MGSVDAGCLEDELENGAGLEAAEMGCESRMEDAVRVLLQSLGEDPEREGLRRTPHRVAKAFREGTTGLCSLSIYRSVVFLCLDLLVGRCRSVILGSERDFSVCSLCKDGFFSFPFPFVDPWRLSGY